MSTSATAEAVPEMTLPATEHRVAALGRMDGFDMLPAQQPGIAVEVFSGIEDAARFRPAVAHVAGRGFDLRALRRSLPDTTIVVDLSREEQIRLGRLEARQAVAADRILLGSGSDLHDFTTRHPALAGRATAATPPVDTSWFLPLGAIGKIQSRDRELKRFRRIHRLGDSTILFVGPFTPDGGLDRALEAVFELRERTPDLRLAAVPYGPVDQRFLASCERRALALGHHCIIEWRSERNDLPFWYALATVVCSPAARGAAALPARLAAAAGRPFVATRGGSAEKVVVESDTGCVIAAGHPETLSATLEALIGDREEADRLGRNARAQAEQDNDAAASAAWIEAAWADARREPARDRDARRSRL